MSSNRLLVIPPWAFSPRVFDALPGGRAFVNQLRGRFEIDVFDWPFTRNGPHPEPSWRATVEAVAAALSPACHVIAVGGGGSAALVAVNMHPDLVASMTFEGLLMPAATLQGLGLDRLADAQAATTSSQRRWGPEVIRLIMSDAGDEDIAELSAMLEEDVDWPSLGTAARVYEAVDLRKEGLRLTMPVLFLEGQLPVPGYGVVREFLHEVAPQTVFADLELWPAHASLPQSGVELAERVSEFILSVDPRGRLPVG